MAIQTRAIFLQNFYLYENTLQETSGLPKRNLYYDHVMALSPYLFWVSEASLLQLKKEKRKSIYFTFLIRWIQNLDL